MQHLLTTALLKGYTSGIAMWVIDWDMFLKFHQITNLRHALLIYKAPTESIIDLLN